MLLDQHIGVLGDGAAADEYSDENPLAERATADRIQSLFDVRRES